MTSHRNLTEPITDKEIEEIGSVSAVQVAKALRISGLSPAARTRVMNRVNNMKHADKAKEIKTSQLVRNGYEKGAELAIPSQDVRGHIVSVQEVIDAGTEQIVVVLEHKEDAGKRFQAHLIDIDDKVLVWPVDRDGPRMRPGPYPWGQEICGGSNMGGGCQRFKGHQGQHTPFVRYAREMDEATQENDRKPTFYVAEHIKNNPNPFFGKMMSVITATAHVYGRFSAMGQRANEPGQFSVTIDGRSIVVQNSDVIRVFPEEVRPNTSLGSMQERARQFTKINEQRRRAYPIRCMEYMGTSPDGLDVHLYCEKEKGHNGAHLVNFETGTRRK